tara:strand:+ start:875 stop:1246 length:372 start_codon:yes stop_codon:yes gene_type:complete
MYQQCNVIDKNRIILSCSNTYGIDTYPASRPQQSNFRFMNGIHGNTISNIYEKYYRINITKEVSGNAEDLEIDFKVGSELSYPNKNGKIKHMLLSNDGKLSYSHNSKIYIIDPNAKLIYKIKN